MILFQCELTGRRLTGQQVKAARRNIAFPKPFDPSKWDAKTLEMAKITRIPEQAADK